MSRAVKRAQGRPKKTSMKLMRQDIEAKGLNEGILLDRNEWRKLIFSFGSCSLPQILGTNGLIVVIVMVVVDHTSPHAEMRLRHTGPLIDRPT